MSVNSKMTNLADEIRVLSGTTEPMGLNAMENHVGEANTDVATEASLIAQITAALEGKAIGGGEGTGGSAMQIATGTFTPTDGTSPITISGLGFAPKSLIAQSVNKTGNGYYFPKAKNCMTSLSIGELLDNNVTVINASTMTAILRGDEYYSVQFTQDGFILSSLDTSYIFNYYSYYYIALG